MAEALRVLRVAEGRVGGFHLETEELSVGAGEYLKSGNPLPDATLERMKTFDAILLGAMGLPEVRWPDGTEMTPQIEIREKLDLYQGIRPIELLDGSLTPLKGCESGEIDMLILRENVEGLFWTRTKPHARTAEFTEDILHISRAGSERLFHAAFQLAEKRRQKVTLVDKANVLQTMAYFREKEPAEFWARIEERSKPKKAPREVRKLLGETGWDAVVAFQTRNPLHRAHEYALVYGLEVLLKQGKNAGAVLNPLIGETKGDDVNAEIRMETYEHLITERQLGEGDSDQNLWKPRKESVPDRVKLLGLDIKMFYGGPKEAVMHGIYRQNFGFTDIIIGRKHADAPYHDGSPIWGDFDAQEIFGKLAGDLRIQPLKVGFAAYYDSIGRVDLTENHPNEKPVSISGKDVRKALVEGGTVDPRIMRESTSRILAAAMSGGK